MIPRPAGIRTMRRPAQLLSINLLISPFKSTNLCGQVSATSDASKTQSGLNANHFRRRCMKERPDTPIPPYYSNRQIGFDLFARSGAPGGTRTPDLLVRSKVVQNSKCRFWCRLQRNAPFISLLSWTEVGLKLDWWGEPLKWHSFFGRNFRFRKSVFASS